MKPDLSAQIVAAYKSGENPKSIANRIGHSWQWVYKQLAIAGIIPRWTRVFNADPEKQNRLARDLYESGLSIANVGARLGITKSLAYSALVKAGTKLRRYTKAK